MAAKLIIEVDGSQHGTDAGKARDDERTRWLEGEGYRIIRFWNNDLTESMDGVLETIHLAIFGSHGPDEIVLKHRRSKK